MSAPMITRKKTLGEKGMSYEKCCIDPRIAKRYAELPQRPEYTLIFDGTELFLRPVPIETREPPAMLGTKKLIAMDRKKYSSVKYRED